MNYNYLVVILAESADVQQELALSGIQVQVVTEIDSIFSVQPASVLAKILNKLVVMFFKFYILNDLIKNIVSGLIKYI